MSKTKKDCFHRKTKRMKKLKCFLILFCIIYTVSSQELVWKAGVHSFFDNNEFVNSNFKQSQTMAGVHFAPEIGLSWNNQHRIFVGTDIMHEFGSDKTIDYYDPIIYYEFDGKPFRFYMGAFPRKNILDKYPRFFFQDSIANYRPTITGLFWEYYSNDNYFNIWLDWTGRQTYERHEAFFMGWSGRYNYGVLYGQLFGYMFHFARTMETIETADGIHDNGLLLTSLGIDFSTKTDFEKLEANIGWSVGLERDRNFDRWHNPSGILSEVKVEYRGLGLFNTYYNGGSQQVFYNDHGGELYWGDPIFRSKKYNRTDIYVNFFKTDVVNIRFSYSFHFSEGNIFQEQALYATFDLNNIAKKTEKTYRYLWDNWFKKSRY